jgi:methylated-DNA-[protein]-cysteine S-methyltransferase
MNIQVKVYTGYIDSPVGILELVSSDIGLRSLSLVDKKKKAFENKIIHYYIDHLKAYFEGSTESCYHYFDFGDHTLFHQKVWKALLEIPYGKTVSYKKLSIQIGNEKAIRAVGTANGKNPIPIIIPCHRVIGSDGSLTGYALGLEMKRKLLHLEKAIPPELF